MTDASVIFVDDDPHIRQAIAQTLTLEDLSIACFEDARSGLESISQDYEGVVLCDYNMPGMDGLEMLDRIRAMDETIPVIILTGQGDISTAVTAMQQGAYDFIEKPFDHAPPRAGKPAAEGSAEASGPARPPNPGGFSRYAESDGDHRPGTGYFRQYPVAR
jgi:DNA-binding NtrC family response regulator